LPGVAMSGKTGVLIIAACGFDSRVPPPRRQAVPRAERYIGPPRQIDFVDCESAHIFNKADIACQAMRSANYSALRENDALLRRIADGCSSFGVRGKVTLSDWRCGVPG
jgi:hypothetical protein